MGRQPWTKIGLYCGTGVAFMALGHLVPKESEFIFALWCSALMLVDLYDWSVRNKSETGKNESDDKNLISDSRKELLNRIWKLVLLVDSLVFVYWLLMLLRPTSPNQSWDLLYVVLVNLFSVATYVGFNNRKKKAILE